MIYFSLQEASSEGLEESQTPDVECPDRAPPPDSSGEKDDTHAVRPPHPHPDPGVTSDPPNEIPTGQPPLYGTLNAQAVTLLHGLPFFPARTFLPENCYTLPLHRDGFSRGASRPEPDLSTHAYLQVELDDTSANQNLQEWNTSAWLHYRKRILLLLLLLLFFFFFFFFSF